MTHAFLKETAIDVEVIQRCTKRPFETLKAARRQLNRGATRNMTSVVAMGTGSMSAYRCQICGAYHLGHKP